MKNGNKLLTWRMNRNKKCFWTNRVHYKIINTFFFTLYIFQTSSDGQQSLINYGKELDYNEIIDLSEVASVFVSIQSVIAICPGVHGFSHAYKRQLQSEAVLCIT